LANTNNTVTTEPQKTEQENIEEQLRFAKRFIRDYQQIAIYKDVNPLDWEDWRWQ